MSRSSARQAALDAAVQPLPGSQPYENRRPVRVRGRFDRLSAIDFLQRCYPHIPARDWLQEIQSGRLTWRNSPITPDQIVRSGMTLIHTTPHTVEPAVNGRMQLLFEDDHLVVLDKPAPLPMHPSGQYHRNTLLHIVNSVYPDQPLRMVHRLDANTTGCVVLCRTLSAAQHLAAQFADGAVDKSYLAKIHGQPAQDEWMIDQAIDDLPTIAGMRLPSPTGTGKASRTRVVVQHRTDDSALVECTPLTGRTNQIRVHLWSAGHPIVGDPSYLPGRTTGNRQTLDVNDPPLCLHANRIAFRHPCTEERLLFVSGIPEWARCT